MVGGYSLCYTPKYKESHWIHHDVGKCIHLLHIDITEDQHKKLYWGQSSGRVKCYNNGVVDEIFTWIPGVQGWWVQHVPGQTNFNTAREEWSKFKQ